MSSLFKHYEHFEFVATLKSHWDNKDWRQVLSVADSLSEQKYSDATLHFVANQFALLIKKYPWNPKAVGTSPETVATRTFLRSERKCYLMNRKFALYDTYRSPDEYVLNDMRNFIRYVIGLEPNIEQILDNCAFGAGASVGVHGNATNLKRKIFSDKWTVSPSASTYAFSSFMRDPYLSSLLFASWTDRDNYSLCWGSESSLQHFRLKSQYVDYNKISFVPKTAKTHRVIAVEPLLNGYLQKGVDHVLRLNLKRIGIDLSNQEANQELARQGSVPGQEDPFVTIDLKSASDSISVGLVKNLLPPDWYSFLSQLRSRRYRLNGKDFPYHKFCSMGNGFCFPLETLIFVACCKACGCGVPGTDFLVYGDDIIVRQSKSAEVIRVLNRLGFSVNTNKTFLEGPFRESCGADWYTGENVRPYTLDHKLDSLENIFKMLNLTKRNDRCKSFFYGIDAILLNVIPRRFQFWRPFIGNPESGIDAFGCEHLTSPTCSYDSRSMTWRCKVLRVRAVLDRELIGPSCQRSNVDMYALLSGSTSHRGQVEYVYRRKTRTTIGIAVYGEATSQWLPQLRI